MASVTTGLKTLTQALTPDAIHERSGDAYIILLDRDNDAVTNQNLRFQYFPASISDKKEVNWQGKDVPGASLPIYQWVSSGARLISFTAQFSTDIDLADYANPVTAHNNLKIHGLDARNVDIRAAILWLRQFQLPTYSYAVGGGNQVTAPPSKLLLGLKNSGIGLSGGFVGPGNIDTMYAILLSMDVTYEAFFPSGLPRIASANLTFAQIAQVGGKINFPDNKDRGKGNTMFGDIVTNGSTESGIAPYVAPRRNWEPTK